VLKRGYPSRKVFVQKVRCALPDIRCLSDCRAGPRVQAAKGAER
jgi:hypothetical protein